MVGTPLDLVHIAPHANFAHENAISRMKLQHLGVHIPPYIHTKFRGNWLKIGFTITTNIHAVDLLDCV